MANETVYYKTALTGGGADALDAVDGTGLSNNVPAFVMESGVGYLYKLNSTSGAAENSPDVITPDTNAGDKRWILQNAWGYNRTLAAAPNGVESIAYT